MNWYFEALKKYAQFSGRSRRKAYWYFQLFYIIFLFVIGFVAAILKLPTNYLINAYQIGLIIPVLSLNVRRMHDVNRSGWYCLVPVYNLILACENGTVGDNDYGPDPKADTFFGAADYEKPYDINR